jgi:hypothetical protein
MSFGGRLHGSVPIKGFVVGWDVAIGDVKAAQCRIKIVEEEKDWQRIFEAGRKSCDDPDDGHAAIDKNTEVQHEKHKGLSFLKGKQVQNDW